MSHFLLANTLLAAFGFAGTSFASANDRGEMSPNGYQRLERLLLGKEPFLPLGPKKEGRFESAKRIRQELERQKEQALELEDQLQKIDREFKMRNVVGHPLERDQ